MILFTGHRHNCERDDVAYTGERANSSEFLNALTRAYHSKDSRNNRTFLISMLVV